MKNIYQCERCGKIFADYEQCYRHESDHFTVSDWAFVFQRECQNRTKYTEKSDAPSVVGVELSRWSDDKGETEKAIGIYQLKEVIFGDALMTDEQWREKDEQEQEEMEKGLE